MVKKVLNTLLVSREYTNVTDRWTDTAWQHRPCWCTASRSMTASAMLMHSIAQHDSIGHADARHRAAWQHRPCWCTASRSMTASAMLMHGVAQHDSIGHADARHRVWRHTLMTKLMTAAWYDVWATASAVVFKLKECSSSLMVINKCWYLTNSRATVILTSQWRSRMLPCIVCYVASGCC